MNQNSRFHKALIRLSLIASLFSGFGAEAAKRGDYSTWKVGDENSVIIDDLHPTQFRVGKAEVDDKRKEFDEMSEKKFAEYLEGHPCPVVIGPGGIPYITDEQHRANASEEAELRHHLLFRAMFEHGQPTMRMKVIENWSNLSQSEFEKRMKDSHYVYLLDRGVLRPFKDLPEHVSEMKNDPYRSVAGFVQDTAYRRTQTYFVQFVVAAWLRKHLGLDDDDVKDRLKNDRKKFLKKVSELLLSSEAASEPWYIGKEKCKTLISTESAKKTKK